MLTMNYLMQMCYVHALEADNAERAKQGLHVMPLDEHLLAALPHMPECSGIALGVDRLLMVAMDQVKIEKVVTFPAEIA